MWAKTNCLRAWLIAACLCLCLPCVGTCYANPTYTISETQLQELQNHLNALEANNETLKEILSTSGEELTAALNALTESKKELQTLKEALRQAKAEAESARQSLQTANDELQKAAQSFKASEAARDRTENRLRNQRNIWEALFFIAAGVAVAR